MQYEEEFVVIQLVANILLQIELQYLALFEIVFQEDIEQLKDDHFHMHNEEEFSDISETISMISIQNNALELLAYELAK